MLVSPSVSSSTTPLSGVGMLGQATEIYIGDINVEGIMCEYSDNQFVFLRITHGKSRPGGGTTRLRKQ